MNPAYYMIQSGLSRHLEYGDYYNLVQGSAIADQAHIILYFILTQNHLQCSCGIVVYTIIALIIIVHPPGVAEVDSSNTWS